MNPVLLSSYSLMCLIYLLTSLVLIAGLRRTNGNASYKPWLKTMFYGTLLWQFIGLINRSLQPDVIAPVLPYTHIIFILSINMVMFSNIQIAYLFPLSVFDQERRWVFRISLGLCAVIMIWFARHIFSAHPPGWTSVGITNSLTALMGIVFAGWTFVIYLRKLFYFRRRDPAVVIPCLLFSVTNFVFIGIGLFIFLVSTSHPMAMPVYFIANWTLLQFNNIIFIIYSVFPIRFQDKLIGFVFASVMTIMTYISLLLIPYSKVVTMQLTYQDELRTMAFIIIGAAIFVLWIFPFILRVSIIRPLEQLLLGIQRADQGDLSVQVPVAVLDEIGTVTKNFNQMMQSLIQSRDKLTQYAETLEIKVIQRTEEVNAQKEELQTTLTELRSTQQLLIHKEKMASLGELTAGIAHEIQNPLNFVKNFSEVSAEMTQELLLEYQMAGHEVGPKANLLEYLNSNLKKILFHSNRASGIVEGMLEHSRIGNGKIQPTNLNALCNEYIRLAYHGYRVKNKDFNSEMIICFNPDLADVKVIPQQIGRVLLNLFINAFYAVNQQQKYSPPNYQPKVTVSTRQSDHHVVITIADNGTGIPNNIQQKIFQPFFTTKPTGEGTGLGLSLSYDIITKGHGGTLTIISEPGEGAEFTISLPLHPGT